jgi:hypothetical protein
MTVNKQSSDIALVFKRVGGVNALVKWIKASDENRERFYMKFGQELITMISAEANAPVEREASLANLATILQNMRDNHRRIEAAEEARTGVRMIDGVAYVRADPDRASNIDGVSSDVSAHGISDGARRDTVPQPSNDGFTPKPRPDVQHVAVVHEQQLSKVKAATPPAPEPYHQPSATELFYDWNGHSRPSWSAPRGWGES